MHNKSIKVVLTRVDAESNRIRDQTYSLLPITGIPLETALTSRPGQA